MAAPALRVLAGPTARRWLQERGWRPQDVRVVPAAAGGPKGLVLNPLDRFLFGHWLAGDGPTIHLLGASIGAWRMAAACRGDADAALARLADAYVAQDYPHEPGRPPSAATVSAVFNDTLVPQVAAVSDELLSHPRRRLHVFTSRGRHLLGREGRLRTPLGYGAAFFSNLASRRALGGWLERVVFSDPRDPLPLPLDDFRTRQVALTAGNLQPAVLASCSIPFWLKAVQDIPGAPPGAYWDGGITDYHLHLRYDQLAHDGLVLYPHFQTSVVPGWLDKGLRGRHRATRALDRVVLLVPSAEWIAGLPGGKLPDRDDFRRFGDDLAARMRCWRTAIDASRRLADEFAEAVSGGRPLVLEPLV
ncbi:phospholipase [Ideonella sp. 4Y16]|uniref:patatin-like phospholipase family protein n=1 Tax=Ideonella alba TaxID=2824118 RepID=UPI001B393DB1|nr:patatin-like phospholipase family protein [Ideonella alba]MBQ0942539.1 phospholipase [Ideonella alba]